MFSIEERMGPRWSEAEILIFLEGLRRHGKDWTAISQDFKDSNAETVHSRTEQMIEAAYQKNKTYLSRSSANPTDFYAIMADHYESYEGVKQNDPKLNSPVNDNLEIPKRRSERPYELRPVVKRPSPRKFESYDIISRQADYSIINNKKLIEAYSKRSFVDFVYSPSIFLTEYAMNKGEEQPISPKFLQWCKAEWFYSYIDKAFFDHNEFEEALKVLKISEIENFSKYEYSLIRNILGRPRRFSSSFISQERKKLSKYREAIKVLQQGKILPSSHHDMLGYIKKNPNSSSRLMVGQRVLSIHPGCKELRSGNILTLDSSRYHIQFDRPDLGVTSVTDTQILPLFSDAKKIPDSEEGSSFVYKPIQEREVISINSAIEGFKAGVNVYAMAFLLKLLERKEALIELLKQYNAEFALKVHDNPQWRPDNDLQQQYAWIVRYK
jgi:DIRP/Myb-like DNA-binding domain